MLSFFKSRVSDLFFFKAWGEHHSTYIISTKFRNLSKFRLGKSKYTTFLPNKRCLTSDFLLVLVTKSYVPLDADRNVKIRIKVLLGGTMTAARTNKRVKGTSGCTVSRWWHTIYSFVYDTGLHHDIIILRKIKVQVKEFFWNLSKLLTFSLKVVINLTVINVILDSAFHFWQSR